MPDSPVEIGLPACVDGANRCPICESLLVEFPEYPELPRVTSDCRPWPAGGTLGSCVACGLIAKPLTGEFRDSATTIYEGYAPHSQGAGHEQRTFDAGGGSDARSLRIARFISQHVDEPSSGTLIDFGCGNGVFIREFLAQNQSWSAIGIDSALHLADAVTAIPRARFAGRLDEARDQVDSGGLILVSLIHSLEHVEHPREMLSEILGRFPQAVLLVQVPDNHRNLFDLVVADHRSHFTRASLSHAFESMDSIGPFQVLDGVVPKELTAIASPSIIRGGGGSSEKVATFDAGMRLRILSEFLTRVQTATEDSDLYIFGSSVAASWISGSLVGGAVSAFVDEDKSRIGRRHLGIPIIAPEQLPTGATVVLPFDKRTAGSIALRLGLDLRKTLFPNF